LLGATSSFLEGPLNQSIDIAARWRDFVSLALVPRAKDTSS
jgi:hypothetical protein